jgi:hypothetical protein
MGETLSTSEAAALVGVSVAHWFRLADRHGVTPVLEGAGIRGPKFWSRSDVERIVSERAA